MSYRIPPATTFVSALPSTAIEGQQDILYNTTTVDDLQFNGTYVWHTDSWANLSWMNGLVSTAGISGTIASPSWIAYAASQGLLAGNRTTFSELHIFHLSQPTALDFRSVTVTGTLEINDVSTLANSGPTVLFGFTTATLNGDVTLTNLTGTATLFEANNPIGGRLTMDGDAVFTSVTATAPKITVTNLTGADLQLNFTFTGAAAGDLVLSGPYTSWQFLAVDGTGSTITALDWSAINPDTAELFGGQFINGTALTTVLIPATPTWDSASFTGNALSQASVDSIICRMSVSTNVPSGVTVDTTGGTNAPPSVAGLQCAGSLSASPNQVSFNHAVDYAITAVNQGTKTFTIAGDHHSDPRLNTAGNFIQVQGSIGNDSRYTVVSATLNSGATDIVVAEALASAIADGTIGN